MNSKKHSFSALICPAQLQPTAAATAIATTSTPRTMASSLNDELSLNVKLLSPPLPKGPPPKPPPRPSSKGHGRSASLDLNTLAIVNNTNAMCPSKHFLSNRCDTTNRLCNNTLVSRPLSPVISECQRSVHPSNITQMNRKDEESNLLDEKAKQLFGCATVATATAAVSSSCNCVDVSTQTEFMINDLKINDDSTIKQSELIYFNDHLEKRIEQLMNNESMASCKQPTKGCEMNWKERCARLEKLNTQLELERSNLMEIRLALEAKLKHAIHMHSSIKPTAL